MILSYIMTTYDLEEKVSEYESGSISERNANTYVMLNSQIVECMTQMDEYKHMVDTPIDEENIDEKDFHVLCDEMESIMNTDMNDISLHEKIKLYLKLVSNIKICKQHIRTKKLQIIEL